MGVDHAAFSFEPTGDVPPLSCGGMGLIKKKIVFFFYKISVCIRPMWVQMRRRHVAYGYMGCSARKSLVM
jgi:hypothetical protein